MASAALVDACAMVAAFNPGDPASARYRALLNQASQEHWSLSTTWPCIVEASYLLSPPKNLAMLRWVAAGAVSVFPFSPDDLPAMVDLMRRYTQAPRTEMDLADASLVWLAGDTGVTQIMTLDQRDFSRYRLPDGRAFEIL